jgi:site-specific recombinase XerD
MENTTNLQPLIKKIAKLFRDGQVNYLQSKHIFKEVRKVNHLKAPKKRGRGTVIRLSRKEYELFINAAFDKSPYTGLMMQTLYETGARVDEFTNLNADDLMLEERRITIREGKGDKRREVPIEEHLLRSLRLHLNGRETGPLFTTTRSERFSNRRIQQVTMEIGKLAGIKKKTNPHALRHTRATQLAEDGMPKDDLKDFLGHEKIETTEIYTKTAASGMERSFRKVTEH